MTDLERRALLGDRQAQEECTRQGIVLPCPWCKGTAKIIVCDDEGNHHPDDYENDPWSGIGYFLYHSESENPDCPIAHDDYTQCGRYIYDSREDAIDAWNTRPAQPIGRCVECKFANTEYGGLYCELDDYQREECDFCSEFEPKAVKRMRKADHKRMT